MHPRRFGQERYALLFMPGTTGLSEEESLGQLRHRGRGTSSSPALGVDQRNDAGHGPAQRGTLDEQPRTPGRAWRATPGEDRCAAGPSGT